MENAGNALRRTDVIVYITADELGADDFRGRVNRSELGLASRRWKSNIAPIDFQSKFHDWAGVSSNCPQRRASPKTIGRKKRLCDSMCIRVDGGKSQWCLYCSAPLPFPTLAIIDDDGLTCVL